MSAELTVTPELVAALLAWYDAGHQDFPWRTQPTPYRVWVSEIMLQQTRIEAARAYFTRWMDALPTVAALAEAGESQYMKLWEGLGYYSRVRNLHRAAVEICARYDGELPADYGQLLALPGIGEYTAGAIASIAFGLAVPAVDGNVLRVFARLQNDPTPVTNPAHRRTVRQQLAAQMPADRPGDWNQALMELGERVCLPNGAPLCDQCPWVSFCAAHRAGTTARVPVRDAPKARRIEPRTVLLLRYGEQVGLARRPDKGLLAGMWEFPALDGALPESAVVGQLRERGWAVQSVQYLCAAKHVFTHVEWHMNGYEVQLTQPPAETGLTFVAPAALRRDYALPSAFRAFLAFLPDESGKTGKTSQTRDTGQAAARTATGTAILEGVQLSLPAYDLSPGGGKEQTEKSGEREENRERTKRGEDKP